MYRASVVLDSLAPNGRRLTTVEATFPRMVLAELRTHRIILQDDEVDVMFRGTDEAGRSLSLNSASSRAIPVEKMLRMVKDDPFIPQSFPRNQKGMQAAEYIMPSDDEYQGCVDDWLQGRDWAVETTEKLLARGVHKQIANRPLEPYMWHTVIMSATEWCNFFSLRCSKMAQAEMEIIARHVKAARELSIPQRLVIGQWHLPYIQPDEIAGIDLETKIKLSVARVARVSYLNHDGVRDIDADINLYGKLRSAPHLSPFEHPAQAMSYRDGDVWSGNFRGFTQLRKLIDGEMGE